MGDTTNLQCRIYACPPEQVRAVLTALAEYHLNDDWMSFDQMPMSALVLGRPNVSNEVSCGSADELAGTLMETAPGASFELWEDPKYEWLGSLWRYTPDLGAFSAECDADGNPQYDANWIMGRLEKGEAITPADVGVPWRAALTALEEAYPYDEKRKRTVGPTLEPIDNEEDD